MLFLQAGAFSSSNSVTYDETFYAGSAENTIFHRRLDPELVRHGVAPVPVIACYLVPAWFMSVNPRVDRWAPGANDRWLVAQARLLNALISGVSLIVLVFGWLLRRHGRWAATVGAGLVTFSPSLVGQVSLAATDAMFAAAVVGNLAVLAWHVKAPSPLRRTVLGAACGLTYSIKYSAVFLGPTVAVVLLLSSAARARDIGATFSIAKGARELVTIGAVAFTVAWALHGFSWVGPPAGAGGHPIFALLAGPAPISGLLFQAAHNLVGHPAFLMGMHSQFGWWHYYPVALILKSTPAEWLLGAAALIVVASSARVPGQRYTADTSMLVWLTASALYLALLLLSRIDAGHRFALPLYPVLFLIGVDRLWNLNRWHKLRNLFVGLLLAMQVGSAARIAPDYLAYFNPVVGSAHGWRYLVDSNLDWGQDLGRLRAELSRLGPRRVLLAYFGTASPESYGIVGDRWTAGAIPALSDYDLFVVSATFLQGVYLKNDPFRALREIPPLARAGSSIFIYDLRDPAVQGAFASQAP
jgi:hypothetical protein